MISIKFFLTLLSFIIIPLISISNLNSAEISENSIEVNIDGQSILGCILNPVTINSSSVGNIENIEWDLDGGMITLGDTTLLNLGMPFELMFDTAGEYTVRLRAWDALCEVSDSVKIIIEPIVPGVEINCSSTVNSITIDFEPVYGSTSFTISLDGVSLGDYENGDLPLTFDNLNEGNLYVISVIALSDVQCPGSYTETTCTTLPCPSCDYVPAQIFFDENKDGLKNNDDYGIPVGHVTLGDKRIYPDEDGNVELYIDRNAVNNFEIVHDSWESTTIMDTIDRNHDVTETLYLGLYLKTEIIKHSLNINAQSGILVCDRESDISVLINNDGIADSIKLELDYTGTFISSPSSFFSSVDTIAKKLFFDFGELKAGLRSTCEFKIRAPSISELPLDSLIYFNGTTSSSTCDTCSISYEWSQQQTCAYDPNDKTVNPAGIDDDHLTILNTSLYYKIRFQNTGNFPAQDVRITDVIDKNLDLQSFEIIEASHPITGVTFSDREIEVEFKNIFLPDSINNEMLSHGFVIFAIDHLDDINDGTVIYNEASIYFDGNPPIITNQTFNKFVSQLSTDVHDITKINKTQLSIYPNPSEGLFFFERNAHSESKYRLFDLMGNLIQEGYIASKNGQLDFTFCETGVYILNTDKENIKIVKL